MTIMPSRTLTVATRTWKTTVRAERTGRPHRASGDLALHVLELMEKAIASMALAGLTYNVVDPARREFCNGTFHLPGSSRQFREGKGGKHGEVNLVDAVARLGAIFGEVLRDAIVPRTEAPRRRAASTTPATAATTMTTLRAAEITGPPLS